MDGFTGLVPYGVVGRTYSDHTAARIQRAADGDEFLFIREVLLEEGYIELDGGTFLRRRA
jgi:hypothetical protein